MMNDSPEKDSLLIHAYKSDYSATIQGNLIEIMIREMY